jgi:hypothetical protein
MSDETVSNEALHYAPAERGFLRAPAKGTDTTANVGVAIRTMSIAFVVFALFGSSEMRHAARNLPGNTVSDVLVEAADRWHLMMQRLGPALVQPIVHRAFDQLRDKRWQW